MIKWTVKHAGAVQTLFAVGADGRTAYERLKGKSWQQPVAEFGERIMYEKKVRGAERKGALEARYEEGVYLGIKIEAAEYYVANSEGGVETTRVVKRRPPAERWSSNSIEAIL